MHPRLLLRAAGGGSMAPNKTLGGQHPAVSVNIKCSSHGERPSAVVCRHHIQVHERSVGFVENSSDPSDLQGWCGDCEALFLRQGGTTDEFRRFNDFALVCVDCYALLKDRHSLPSGSQGEAE